MMKAKPRPSSPIHPREWDWPLSPTIRQQFRFIAERLLDLEVEDPEAACLREEIRRLPGFPTQAKPWDIINFINIPTTTVTVPGTVRH